MKKLIFSIGILGLVAGCGTTKKTTEPIVDASSKYSEPDFNMEVAAYNPSETRKVDLIHTKLDVRFDFEKAYLHGKAVLMFKPYFYPVSSVTLDAKGFDIKSVKLTDKDEETSKEAKYNYDGKNLNINLEKEHSKTDTLKVIIEYTAKPNERITEGSSAISSDKGLYFIDPLDKDSDKPTQIWTQGETEANSAWFPTIDAPNERMTQELYITVDNKYVTLSNGLMMFSLDNGDGTHTDYWKQELNHAPYLTMMAIGDYAIVKDKWRDIDVNYYVEKKYEPYAREIFGKTPEMLEFYSKVLGVDYAWDKYHQVVVRDYVSGAMENTGAVIFGEFIQRTHREMLDDDDESTVAHELFHHWFGDLVTCESWANLPLNESFATYGEYLWIEHKYGREAADHHIQSALNQYLMESRQKQVDMIRFDYEDKEDMFDSHSYAKGGRILHMLRKYVGDEAFFESLKLYLNTNKFTSVEIHQLRLAFEKVTGEDLNWFFNQWFFSSGHPDIKINTSYDEVAKKAKVEIEQSQDLESTPLYKLPLTVDIYIGKSKVRHHIVVTKMAEEFLLDCPDKPDLINVDAEKMLLCAKSESKTPEQLAFQFRNAPLYLDKYEAIEGLFRTPSDSLTSAIVMEALNDEYWNIRSYAIKNSKKITKTHEALFRNKLQVISKTDKNSKVRAAAIKQISASKDAALLDIYIQAMKDSSYLVIAEALQAITMIDGKEAMKLAKTAESEESASVMNAIAVVYSKHGTDSENQFFIDGIKKLNGFNRYGFITQYSKFLENCNEESINKALPVFEDVARGEGTWWMRLSGVQALTQIYGLYSERETKYRNEMKKHDPSTSEFAETERKVNYAREQKDKVFGILRNIRNSETDKNMLRVLESYK